MNSSSIRGQRDIQPVIDENANGGLTRFGNRETHELYQSPPLKILLTNLNPAGSRGNSVPDGIVK